MAAPSKELSLSRAVKEYHHGMRKHSQWVGPMHRHVESLAQAWDCVNSNVQPCRGAERDAPTFSAPSAEGKKLLHLAVGMLDHRVEDRGRLHARVGSSPVPSWYTSRREPARCSEGSVSHIGKDTIDDANKHNRVAAAKNMSNISMPSHLECQLCP